MALFAGKLLPHRDFHDHAIPPPLHRNPVHDAATGPSSAIIATDIPARLDALPFGRFHLLVIAALGITWILDGLEVTLVGALSGELKQGSALGLSNAQIGLAGSCYLAGAVLGAIFFGWLTDRWGRKKLFTITLAIYLLATAATGLSWDAWSFVVFRFITGAGIGGEYTAINSTIQELIPARLRGWTDLIINGSFWLGAAMGAGGSLVLLDPAFIDPAIGWRLAFLIGAAIGLVILIMRLWISESPRWLVTHGFPQAAHAVRNLSPAHPGGAYFDGRAGVLLQRDLLHLCADPHRLLRHTSKCGRLVHPAVRRGQRARAAPARPAIRHRRPQDHDRVDLCAVRHHARRHRLSVQPGSPDRVDADRRLDDRVLLRLRRGELGLSDGERDFPAGDTRARHRFLLFHRHRHRRPRRPAAVRHADLDRLARRRRLRLCARRDPDGRRRRRPGPLGHRCRAQIARNGEPATCIHRLNHRCRTWTQTWT